MKASSTLEPPQLPPFTLYYSRRHPPAWISWTVISIVPPDCNTMFIDNEFFIELNQIMNKIGIKSNKLPPASKTKYFVPGKKNPNSYCCLLAWRQAHIGNRLMLPLVPKQCEDCCKFQPTNRKYVKNTFSIQFPVKLIQNC